jgi:hypothetical protein
MRIRVICGSTNTGRDTGSRRITTRDIFTGNSNIYSEYGNGQFCVINIAAAAA